MGKCTVEGNKIKCVRGSLAKMQSRIKDNQNNEYYCKLSKKMFDELNVKVGVEVFDDKGIYTKKFVRSYLSFVEEL